MVASGTIIVLNGPSSAGKSSITKELQNLFDEPYLHTAIDGFIGALPAGFIFRAAGSQGFSWKEARDEENPLMTVQIGPWGKKLIAGMYPAIAALANAGNNIIHDDVILHKETYQLARQAFATHNVYFIGVRCSLEVLEKREQARPNRPDGSARAQWQVVHTHGPYDFEVDTSSTSPEECARHIKNFIDAHPKPQGLT